MGTRLLHTMGLLSCRRLAMGCTPVRAHFAQFPCQLPAEAPRKYTFRAYQKCAAATVFQNNCHHGQERRLLHIKGSNTRDFLSVERCDQLMVTIRNDPPTQIPTLAPLFSHWLLFQTRCPLSKSIAVPDEWRRMFGGSTLIYNYADKDDMGLRVEQEVRRTSTIESVVDKPNASSPLKLCTIRHDYHCTETDALKLSETQTIVYIQPKETTAPSGSSRQKKASKSRVPAVKAPSLRTVSPSQTMLFRYSALTFNGHRIHYDVDYCRTVEGYDDLVVHGPLIATLLGNLLGEEIAVPVGRRIRSIAWRAFDPVLCNDSVTLHGVCTDAHGLPCTPSGNMSTAMGAVLYATKASNSHVAVEAIVTFEEKL